MLQPGGQPSPPPDPSVQALENTAWLSLTDSLATAQTIERLAGLIVGEGLTQVLNEVLGAKRNPVSSDATPDATDESSCPAQLSELGTRVLKEQLVRSLVNRLLDLHSINSMLTLSTSDQLRKWGTELRTSSGAQQATRPQPQVPVMPSWPPFPPPAPFPFAVPHYIQPTRPPQH